MCEGQAYRQHTCSGPMEANHTLINKRKIQGIRHNRGYFDQPINISYVCQGFHNMYGETKEYRKWFYTLQCYKFGTRAVKRFLMNAPMKIKERYE